MLKKDIWEATGSLQFCAGKLLGYEAAVHYVQTLLDSPDTEAALLVDATNVLNPLNQQSIFFHYID